MNLLKGITDFLSRWMFPQPNPQRVSQIAMVLLTLALGANGLEALRPQTYAPKLLPLEVAPVEQTVSQHTDISLARIERLKHNTKQQIERDRLPPDIEHHVPAAYQGQIVRSLPLAPGDRAIALTFDDGPGPYTAPILDILREQNIRASFFVLGRVLSTYPELLQRIVADGHILGNHTWSHPYLVKSHALANQEIEQTAELIYQYTRVRTQLFRPPGGFLNNALTPYAAAQNYAITLWSVDSSDYVLPREGIIERVVNGIHPGAIVLLHDGGGPRHHTVAALPVIIKQLREQGYEFVTVTELMERSQAAATRASESAHHIPVSQPPQ
ncbi:polysaccharide deacetylase family protein [Phormidium yuhuli AB48]|uniref:Polysaccharide deacetylase family protein n=1 Tax=Phormidium yuhuli AB48 TaxID=2940671 RepID=A0ABY5AW09_9CYAN|nr:polysaccharide deacetylase family protein [Phormidium yuhuli]USR92409.1 polysaccharide deacetylase family protein [Phormidium yuhuli AB48]